MQQRHRGFRSPRPLQTGTCAPLAFPAPADGNLHHPPTPADGYLCAVAPFLLEEELLLELVVGVILVPRLQELEPRNKDKDKSAMWTRRAPTNGSL